MECVGFEYVLDFELERPSSIKSLKTQYCFQIKAKLFAALSMVITAKALWSSSRYSFCNEVQKKKKKRKMQLPFLLTLNLLHIYFFTLKNAPRVTGNAYSF